MKKHILVVTLLSLIVISVLVAVFAESVASFVQTLLKAEKLANIANLLTIVSIMTSFFLSIIAGILYLFKRNDAAEQVPSAVASELPVDSQTLVKNYYQELHSACQKIDLALVNIKFSEYARALKKVNLPVVYQEMEVAGCQSKKQIVRSDDAEERFHVKGQERKALTKASSEAENCRLIILGDAGMGKSMFVENLAWQIAGTHLDEMDGRLPDVFHFRPVVRVRLRSVVMQAHINEQDINKQLLLQAMQDSIVDLLTEQDGQKVWKFLQKDLLSKGVILLDGLDEVPETKGMRIDALDAIYDLEQMLGKQAKLIITSRPYVFDDNNRSWLDAFSCVELLPMSNVQIEQFIGNWYRLMRKHHGYTGEEAAHKAHELFIDLLDRDYLLEPSRRPLLLTLLISLHFSWGILPHSRANLYKEAIELMLERWARRIHMKHPDYPLTDYEKRVLTGDDPLKTPENRKRALQQLAMKAHKEKTLQIEELKIKGLFSNYLPPDTNASNLLDFIRYRSGILKPGIGSNFEFYHRSFQDYLVALDIAEKSDWEKTIGTLLREEGRDWWEQVFLLLVSAKVAGNSQPEATSLMRRFVPEKDNYQDYSEEKWELFFLSVKALVEQKRPLESYDDVEYLKLKKRVLKHLLNLVQGEYSLDIKIRARAGRLLGELGDPRSGVNIIRDKADKSVPNIDWLPIKAGSFQMGFKENEIKLEWDKYATPDHRVKVNSFKMSRYLVTNAQFKCFIKAGGYKNTSYWRKSEKALEWLKGQRADLSLVDDNPDLKKSYENWLGQETTRQQPWFWEQRKWNNSNHPVVGVSWYEAIAYCEWLKTTQQYKGWDIRLPTEVEWEYAARGVQGLTFAWGETVDENLGNYDDTGLGRTSTVGLFPTGKAHNLYDMSGNVWEWTMSQWGEKLNSPDYTYKNWDQDEKGRNRNEVDKHALRIIRGGSWDSSTGYLRCAIRDRYFPEDRSGDIGFRVVCVES